MQKRVQNVASRSWTMQKNTSQNSLTQKLLLLYLDNNLEQSDLQVLINLRKKLKDYSLQSNFRLGILTGRSIKAAKYQYSQLHLPSPSVWICRAGTEIYYDDEEKSDILWQDSISVDWDRTAVVKALSDLKNYFVFQSLEQQGPFKVSYLLKEPCEGLLPLVRKRLRQFKCSASPHLRCHWYLDIVPLRASRAEAIRFLTLRWGLSLDQVLVVASEQGDGELIKGLTTAVVPVEHDPSLEGLKSQQRVFFSSVAREGVVDGLTHFRFLRK